MTSNDIDSLKLLLERHFAENQAQISEMKAIALEMKKDNAEFRAQIKDDINSFKTEVREDINSFKEEVRKDIDSFKTEVNSKLEAVRSDIVTLQIEVVGLKHDVAGLYHWDYWLLSIILVIFAMPQIVASVKSLFSAITEGISGIISLFRKENSDNNK